MKIRTGDTVVVITGKDKGKTGQVLRLLKGMDRVVIGGINMRTKHIKETPNAAGQRIQYEASIHASNVMLVDSKTKKRTRAGYKIDEKGKKTRIAKKSGEAIAKGSVAKKKAPIKEDAEKVSTEKGKKEEVKVDSAADNKDSKKPFWKRVGFGEDAIREQGEVEGEPRMKEDRSVPDQGKSPDAVSHKRGK